MTDGAIDLIPWAILSVVFLINWLKTRTNGGLDVEAAEAICVLLEQEVAVECKGWHIYKSKSDRYVLLNFNENANLMLQNEESFTDAGDAVCRFLEKVGGLQVGSRVE